MSIFTTLYTHRIRSSLMLGIGSVAAGTASAAIYGKTEYLPATLCLLFVIFAQLSGNIYYRYYDLKNKAGYGVDSQIRTGSLHAGDSVLKEGSFAMLLLALMVGFSIAAMAGGWALVVGAFIAAVGWISCGGDHPMLRTPLGIVCSFVLFGPVCVVSTAIIQTMHDSPNPVLWNDITPALYMGIVMGLMSVNSTLLYSYSTFLTDSRNSKTTFVTRYGRKATRILYLVNGILYTSVSLFMCMQLKLRVDGLDMMPSIVCLILDILIWRKMTTTPRYRLEELIDYSNFNMLLMGMLSFIVFELTGTPDDSTLTFFGI